MGRYTGPKDRLSRREGRELFGRDPAKIRRLKQPPGQHGASRRRMPSEYGRQLREKQALKRMYGMRERQFKRFFKEAANISYKDPNLRVGDVLLQLLERRLDNVVYRLGIARTRPQARQFVTRGHILVDDKPVTVPSYLVKPGEKVRLKPESLSKPFFIEILREVETLPPWLEVSQGAGHIVRLPEAEELQVPVDMELITAFYSR